MVAALVRKKLKTGRTGRFGFVRVPFPLSVLRIVQIGRR